MTRRRLLAAGGAAAVLAAWPSRNGAAAAARAAAVPVAPGLEVVPRAAWAPDLLPVGVVPDEPDVRFLLVHHTVSPNDYDPDGAVELLRGIYGFHTSRDKGWPDVAYNFFVDRFGVVYEGRTGSIDGAKAVDATGGSQGFAQLGSFLGDHSSAPPTDAAVASMGRLLGWLAARHGVDVAPGAAASFVSRGSNRHPAGVEVTTPTVAGHRDMSRTACPGDGAYPLVADGTFARLAAETAAAIGGTAPPPPTTTEAVPTAPTSAPDPSTTAEPGPTDVPAPPPAPAPSTAADEQAGPVPIDSGGPSSDELLPVAVAVGAAATVATGIALVRRKG